MPCKVQLLLPSIGLELYQLGVQIWAKKLSDGRSDSGKSRFQRFENVTLECVPSSDLWPRRHWTGMTTIRRGRWSYPSSG